MEVMKIFASSLVALAFTAACADGYDGAHASTPATNGKRVAATTITLPPRDAIPVGAPTILVPVSGGPRASGAAAATDELLGGAPQTTSAEAVVRTSLYPRALACYGALRDRGAHGRVVLALQVRVDGSVAASTAEVAAGVPADAVQCMEASAKSLIFSLPGRRGAAVTIPMLFAPDADRGAPYDGAADAVAQGAIVPALLGCYEAAGDAGGEGGIDIVVRMGAGGAVDDVRGERDTTVGANVALCAAEKLKSLHFDLAAGREIDVPIELRRAAGTVSTR
jgi:hypothetical protein